MSWLVISLQWYSYLFLLGLIFLPLTTKIFKKFSFDLGFPFSKTMAIIFTSYAVYFLSWLKIFSFSRQNLFFLLIIFTLINLFILKKNKKNFFSLKFSILIIEELLFLFSFLFWVFIRGQEPSIHNLEKFMDFGFINSILRSKFFPPLDIWYAGNYPINYYYFGHLTGAFLIKLTGIIPAVGYNLILANIFALAITQVFSLTINLLEIFEQKLKLSKKIVFGLFAAFLVNLSGNLHTIYILTKGYHNENPIPFWQIFSFCNSLFPSLCQKIGETLISYWYPDATRFIPYTIHEFPSYSYVVADLHGHVFDIPFVLLTLAILLIFLILSKENQNSIIRQNQKSIRQLADKNQNYNLKFKIIDFIINSNFLFLSSIFLGFLIAIHYMTNAFDGPIYFLLSLITLFLIFGFSEKFFHSLLMIVFSFIVFSYPFSSHFKPFVSGIGVNCGSEIFSYQGKLGPFLFEKGNCQTSPFWMLFVLWGFFWVSFLIFILTIKKQKINNYQLPIINYLFILFSFGTFLVIIPEFFYIKDIYPAHFRANTMFKLGYQAFIMMSLASAFVFFLIKKYQKTLLIIIYSLLFIFIFIYPFFAIPSYYGNLKKPVVLDGSLWLKDFYPEDKEIIDWLNKNIINQPVILEAQGNSYTDYERISAMTGLPTVAGWWVHEWLWRGSANIVGERIPEIVNLYESSDLALTKKLIKKYQIKYIIVSTLERQKYQKLNEEKFLKIGKLIYQSTNKKGAIYQVN
ncbi:MAG: DUF2298 domain-containing protein [Patescibacteria group bacterium]|nr:DUF2298 domain-containing protein [Patescibacteria group bacterium]